MHCVNMPDSPWSKGQWPQGSNCPWARLILDVLMNDVSNLSDAPYCWNSVPRYTQKWLPQNNKSWYQPKEFTLFTPSATGLVFWAMILKGEAGLGRPKNEKTTTPTSHLLCRKGVQKESHIPGAPGLPRPKWEAFSLLESPPLKSASEHNMFNLAHVRAI